MKTTFGVSDQLLNLIFMVACNPKEVPCFTVSFLYLLLFNNFIATQFIIIIGKWMQEQLRGYLHGLFMFVVLVFIALVLPYCSFIEQTAWNIIEQKGIINTTPFSHSWLFAYFGRYRVLTAEYTSQNNIWSFRICWPTTYARTWVCCSQWRP